MTRRLRIKTKQPWIAYPGSTLQQNYAEDREHGYLSWNIASRDDFSVEFRPLPNPRPFITIDWMGAVKDTLEVARDYPNGSRFRVRHKDHLAHKDALALTQQLKQELLASEVTFKGDHHVASEYFNAGNTVLMKDDLRNPQVLLKLVKEYHGDDAAVSTEDWAAAGKLIEGYLASINDDSVARNVLWTLKHLKFDNLLCYGEGNNIDFQNMNGIVGIFGPNRSGKSALPGTLMYSLFNATDRGSIKNLHVCNTRKPYCLSRVIIGINGIDYAIERQTTKHENKRGEIHAATALNFYRVDEGVELRDLAGEQRTDTDKEIRKLIGTAEDCALTSLSAQGEINQIIELGSTKRSQMLSRFLDLDIFYKMYQLAQTDLNESKSLVKNLPDKDWQQLAKEKSKTIKACDARIAELTLELADAHERLGELRTKLSMHHDVEPVSQIQVEQQRDRIGRLERELQELTTQHDELLETKLKLQKKIDTIELLRKDHDLNELRKRQDAYRKLEASVASLKRAHDEEVKVLRQQKRSLKILKEVPCGDQFPTCSFIKDAHSMKELIPTQKQQVEDAAEAFKGAEQSLEDLGQEDLAGKIQKLEELNQLYTKLTKQMSDAGIASAKIEPTISQKHKLLDEARSRLASLETALANDENVEVVSLRNELDSVQKKIVTADAEKLSLASTRGREIQAVETLATDRKRRQQALQQLKLYELIAYAFSKKGVPSVILANKLPAINAELTKILSGIVDFTVELEHDSETDQLEFFLNYGDSRRIIELGSGMEKAVGSIALRVALRNISSLPKSDFLIIDEGFGVFDDVNVEAVSRLLTSLKRYFRVIMIITHIDSVKDIADHVIEITKHEKDSKVTYE